MGGKLLLDEVGIQDMLITVGGIACTFLHISSYLPVLSSSDKKSQIRSELIQKEYGHDPKGINHPMAGSTVEFDWGWRSASTSRRLMAG